MVNVVLQNPCTSIHSWTNCSAGNLNYLFTSWFSVGLLRAVFIYFYKIESSFKKLKILKCGLVWLHLFVIYILRYWNKKLRINKEMDQMVNDFILKWWNKRLWFVYN